MQEDGKGSFGPFVIAVEGAKMLMLRDKTVCFGFNMCEFCCAGALVQKFGGFKWPSIIMGTFILAVGIGLLALRWIAAAWKDHMLRTRGNLGSLPSGLSSEPSRDDFVERGGHPSQVGMLDADRNGVTSRAAGRAGRAHTKE